MLRTGLTVLYNQAAFYRVIHPLSSLNPVILRGAEVKSGIFREESTESGLFYRGYWQSGKNCHNGVIPGTDL